MFETSKARLSMFGTSKAKFSTNIITQKKAKHIKLGTSMANLLLSKCLKQVLNK